MQSISDLEVAAQQIAKLSRNIITIPPELLHNLQTAIKVREWVAKIYSAQGMDTDHGHAYILSVLRRCYEILTTSNETTNSTTSAKNNKRRSPRTILDVAQTENAAAAASRKDDDLNPAPDMRRSPRTVIVVDEEEFPRLQASTRTTTAAAAAASCQEDDDDLGPATDIQEETTKKSSSETKEKGEQRTSKNSQCATSSSKQDISIDEFLYGDDSFRAATFLINMDELMEMVNDRWMSVKSKWRSYREQGLPCFDLLATVTRASVATNMAIKHVYHLEQLLSIESTYLSSFYHVLAYLRFKSDITVLVEKAKKKNEATAKRVVDCIADLVREAFVTTNYSTSLDTTVRKISKELERITNISREEINLNVESVFQVTLCEFMKSDIHDEVHFEDFDIPAPNSWLSNLSYIGGDRSILSTHHLIQNMSARTKPSMKNAFKMDGMRWNERTGPAQKIIGDMDNLLAAEIFPELWYSCQSGRLSNLTGSPWAEVLPFFKVLGETQVDCSAALSFGFHCILTSIFCLQGQDDVKTLAIHARLSFDRFVLQAKDNYVSDLPKYGAGPKACLQNVLSRRRLASGDGRKASETSVERAFWNPFCAGTFLAYTSILSVQGCGVIDNAAQGRIVLHLYNAMRCCGFIQDNIFLLSVLDHAFSSCRLIWRSRSRAEHGNFAKFYLLASSASRPGEFCQSAPTEVSRSYQSLFQGDFASMPTNINDNTNHDPNRLDEVFDRIQYAIDTMTDEESLLRINFLKVGDLFNEFVAGLTEVMGWKQKLELWSIEGNNRVPSRSRRHRRLPEELAQRAEESKLVHSLLMKYDQVHPISKEAPEECHKAAEFMKAFFGNMDKSNFAFY